MGGRAPGRHATGLRLLTMPEVADVLGRAEALVRRLVAEGEIPARRIGRRWYVAEPELAAWLGAQVEPPRQGVAGREVFMPRKINWRD